MKEFFKRLFNKNRCEHVWETVNQYVVRSYEEIETDGTPARMPLQNRIIYVQRCTKCGELKHYTVNLGS